jgi:hypothetical protein
MPCSRKDSQSSSNHVRGLSVTRLMLSALSSNQIDRTFLLMNIGFKTDLHTLPRLEHGTRHDKFTP